MKPGTYITTSWDDGHPIDLRVAELLTKYGIRGTFYVPKTAEHGTMTAAHIRKLSPAFELGAHTLHHVVLTGATEQMAWQEISDSKSWLEDNTGSPCLLFCPPKGRYAGRHLEMIRRAGYLPRFAQRRTGLARLPAVASGTPADADHSSSLPAPPPRFRQERDQTDSLRKPLAVRCSRPLNRMARAGAILVASRPQMRRRVPSVGHSWELQEAGQWRRQMKSCD
jgi:peptidoglycan-N-acetylglucosamine deacetylase